MADARLRDVAERAGVSLTTASIVTRRQPGSRLSAETRERVLRAAAEIGYQPRARTEASPVVGLVVDEGFLDVGEGALLSAMRHSWAKGCILVLLPRDAVAHDDDRGAERAGLSPTLSGVIRVRTYVRGPALERTVVLGARRADRVSEHVVADCDRGDLGERFAAVFAAALNDILGRGAQDMVPANAVVSVG